MQVVRPVQLCSDGEMDLAWVEKLWNWLQLKKLDILSNEKLRYFRFTLNPFDSLYIIREDLPEKTQLFFWASLPNFFALEIKMKRKWRNMFIG